MHVSWGEGSSLLPSQVQLYHCQPLSHPIPPEEDLLRNIS